MSNLGQMFRAEKRAILVFILGADVVKSTLRRARCLGSFYDLKWGFGLSVP